MENNKSPSRWERFKAKTAERHKGTLLELALSESTPEEWRKIQNADFDAAKKLSDFVGMLVRLGFVNIAFLYFASSWGVTKPWYEGLLSNFCLALSGALYLVLFYRITSLFAVYWLSDTLLAKTKSQKIFLMILGIPQALIACYAVSQLAHAVAKASTLLP